MPTPKEVLGGATNVFTVNKGVILQAI
jgi:hypothetical protein